MASKHVHWENVHLIQDPDPLVDRFLLPAICRNAAERGNAIATWPLVQDLLQNIFTSRKSYTVGTDHHQCSITCHYDSLPPADTALGLACQSTIRRSNQHLLKITSSNTNLPLRTLQGRLLKTPTDQDLVPCAWSAAAAAEAMTEEGLIQNGAVTFTG